MRLILTFLLLIPLLLSAESVVFFGSASDSELFAAAFQKLRLPKKIRFEYYCANVDDPEKIDAAVRRADVLIVNARGRDVRKIAETKSIFPARKCMRFPRVC